jgi:hypothetical protein
VALVTLLALTAGACQRHGVISGGGTLNSTAGTVDVQCVDRSQIKIIGFNPAAGYTGEIIVGQQASNEASLKFTNPNANDYTVIIRCVDSQPSLHEVVIEDTTLSG